MTQLINEVLKLSPSERISMVEAIWDSLAESADLPGLSPETKQLLNSRLEVHNLQPDEGSEWSEVKARIKKQL